MKIIDTTLRDGEQSPGFVLSRNEKIQLAHKLLEAGIDELEIGIPAVSTYEQETISQIVSREDNKKIMCWCRATIGDLTITKKTGTKRVHFAVPVSDIQINAFNKNKTWVMKSLSDCISFSTDHFDFVSIGLQDTSRANSQFLLDCLNMIHSKGIKRVRISDTVGILTPLGTIHLIEKIKHMYPQIEIDFHAHNDFGNATSNSITALESGANFVSTTLGGVGERCGNAATELVLINLIYNHLIPDNRYKINDILKLSKDIFLYSGREIPPDKPLIGEHAFKHESGIHCSALMNDSLSFEPIKMEQFDLGKRTFIIGKHSGLSSLKNILEIQNIQIAPFQEQLLLKKIKDVSEVRKRGFTESEIFDLCQNYLLG